MSFDILHCDELTHIFDFLPTEDLFNARQVCSQWRSACEWKPLWRNFEVVLSSSTKNGDKVYRDLNRAPIVTSLEIRTGINENEEKCEEIVSTLFRCLPNKVVELRLEYCTIFEDDLIALLNLCGNGLEILRIDWSSCVLWNQGQPMQRLREFISLRSLTVDIFNPPHINVFSASFPSLQELHLRCVSEDSVPKILENHNELCCLRTQLRKFSLTTFDRDLMYNFPHVLEYFPELRFLYMEYKCDSYFLQWCSDRGRASLDIQIKADCDLYWDELPNNLIKNVEGFNTIQNLTLRFAYPPCDSVISGLLDRFNGLEKLKLCEVCWLSVDDEAFYTSLTGKPVRLTIPPGDLEVVYVIGCDCGCLDSYRERLINRFSYTDVKYANFKVEECECLVEGKYFCCNELINLDSYYSDSIESSSSHDDDFSIDGGFSTDDDLNEQKM